MNMPFILLGIFVVVAVLGAVAKAKLASAGSASPRYTLKEPFLNGEELKLFALLRTALPEFRVLPQIAMSQLLQPRSGKDRSALFGSISQKVVDFAVFDQSFKLVGVVEYDGPTHDRGRQKKADQVKDGAFAAAGIEVWRVRKQPTSEQIRAHFFPSPVAAEKVPA